MLDLSHLEVDAQLGYLRRLPEALLAQRLSHGIPHWVIYEEAHQRAWLSDGAGLAPGCRGGRDLPGDLAARAPPAGAAAHHRDCHRP
ncbi:MAG: hypothetical protein R2731_13290 [Nocardioides sp.]